MKRIFYIMIFILLTVCESCDDIINPKTELEKLPPATQQSKNTFGCLVNDKAWLPKGQSGSNGIFVDMSVPNFLSIHADNEIDHTGLSLVFNDDKKFEVNKVYMLSNSIVYYATYNLRTGHGICFYEYSHVVSGNVLFSKFENHVISGTFEFITYNPDCGDTIKVTNGRFDLLYAN